MRKWARDKTPHVNVVDATERFIDYWRAQPGEKGRKMDWVATWRNWLRREEDDPRARSRPIQPTFVDETREPVEVLRDLWKAADAEAVAKILRVPFVDKGQPPSDTTPPDRWIRETRQAWIAQHRNAAVEVLQKRSQDDSEASEADLRPLTLDTPDSSPSMRNGRV
jgi:hypothetical protein